MTAYVALLRGINVGGHAALAMDDLRRLALALGYVDVKTYLQSGNLVFSSAADDPTRAARDIEKQISEDLGLAVTVLVRTAEDLISTLATNPFLNQVTDLTSLYVTFLADEPVPERIGRLDPVAGGTAQFALVGREVHIYCPDGSGRTKVNNTYFEKRLGLPATTRNWNTVTRLRELASR